MEGSRSGFSDRKALSDVSMIQKWGEDPELHICGSKWGQLLPQGSWNQQGQGSGMASLLDGHSNRCLVYWTVSLTGLLVH